VGEFTAIKQRQQQMWATGDYAIVGATLVIVSELLHDIQPRLRIHKVRDRFPPIRLESPVSPHPRRACASPAQTWSLAGDYTFRSRRNPPRL